MPVIICIRKLDLLVPESPWTRHFRNSIHLVTVFYNPIRKPLQAKQDFSIDLWDSSGGFAQTFEGPGELPEAFVQVW